MDLLTRTREYAIHCHESTNHHYDGDKPYAVHLQMVVDAATQFLHLIPEADRDEVIGGCWVHDCIEDCRQTYNDVKKATSEPIAELAYALTNEKGRNRKERASDQYYEGIRNTKHAAFIKACDRVANVTYSKQSGSRMFELYKQENDNFVAKIHHSDYQPLFDHLSSLFDQ